MELQLSPGSIADYKRFLQIKRLPVYRIQGRVAWFPDEYAETLGLEAPALGDIDYKPSDCLFDYQEAISRLAIHKRKFAVFGKCGLGKSLIYFEYIRAVMRSMRSKGTLLFTPAMVVEQMAEEYERFYPGSPIEIIPSGSVGKWLKTCGGKIGITNYEALKNDLDQGQLGCLVADESSVMKSHYGNYAAGIIRLGRGLQWKLAGTGTPAPNDRIEYANHAVFLDQFPTVNSFLATYFVNRGQTQERWALKKHALVPFYRSLSHWCIFLTDPSVYGWKDNTDTIPPINIHVEDVEMTDSQRKALHRETGQMFAANAGGITKRHVLSRIAKGLDGSETLKYDYIRDRVLSWPEKSTIIWCWFNEEQARMEKVLPDALSIKGATPMGKRREMIHAFQTGRVNKLISKPDVLGFGLNLQIATKQMFSSLIDSYEKFHQAIHRSNRIGSTEALDVHIPVLEIERPMAENVLRKMTMIDRDTRTQERIFRAAQLGIGLGDTVELERMRELHSD